MLIFSLSLSLSLSLSVSLHHRRAASHYSSNYISHDDSASVFVLATDRSTGWSPSIGQRASLKNNNVKLRNFLLKWHKTVNLLTLFNIRGVYPFKTSQRLSSGASTLCFKNSDRYFMPGFECSIYQYFLSFLRHAPTRSNDPMVT
jgi:hypothetical protein